MVKRISILGSTGSIGKSTLSVVEQFPERFKVVALAAGNNIDLLERQIRKFSPLLVAVLNPASAEELKKRCADLPVRVLSGIEGMIEVAAAPETTVTVSAIVGTAGLIPTLAAIRARKTIALANKEVLVSAGELVMAESRSTEYGYFPLTASTAPFFSACRPERAGTSGN